MDMSTFMDGPLSYAAVAVIAVVAAAYVSKGTNVLKSDEPSIIHKTILVLLAKYQKVVAAEQLAAEAALRHAKADADQLAGLAGEFAATKKVAVPAEVSVG